MDVAVSGREQKLTDSGTNHSKNYVEVFIEELDKKELMKELEVTASGGVQEPTDIGVRQELINPGGKHELTDPGGTGSSVRTIF